MRIYEENLFSTIEIRKPYFALKEIEISKDILNAEIIPEQSLINEFSPITAGEASRHLAILGSCSLALKPELKNNKHYFLATKAVLKRIDNNPLPYKTSLRLEASSVTTAKHQGKAHSVIKTDLNVPIYSLECDYLIMKKNIFQRQYKDNKLELRNKKRRTFVDYKKFMPLRKNPYKTEDVSENITNIKINGNILTGSLKNTNADLCMGHFPQYPAMPVAFVSSYLGIFF
ncbi:MAG: hypothetical protein GY830_02130 [Bacteroidetes bacterium]|nr:hypothetical protein [Bacteroidota bacterium]